VRYCYGELVVGLLMRFVLSLGLNCAIAVIGFVCMSAAVAENSADSALELYNKGEYSKAYQLFVDAGAKKPADGTAFLYAANCLYRMGRKDGAIKMYSYVRTNFAASRNASAASEMLKRLEGGAPEAASSPAKASVANPSVAGSSAKNATGDDSETVRSAAATGPADFSDLIEIVRPLFGHPPVSSGAINTVRRAVQGLPPNISATLRSQGARIYLCTTLIDKEPSLKTREGRGYDGHTYKSCPGMFWNNRIYLCERTLDEGDDSVKEPSSLESITGTFYHECGHALDWYHNNISSSEEFKHAYLLDSAKIDAETRTDLAYFLQKSDAGQQECCGELIGILLGKQDPKTIKMRAAFPGTLKLLRSKLEI
jgi:tetratricopeptide (TPR) repeat protein